MSPSLRRAVISVLAVAIVGTGLALAGSHHGREWRGVPVFALAVAAAFVIQWLVFIPSYLARTEKFFDLTGAVTYIAVTVFVALASGELDARSWIIAIAVIVWAARLGTFLFARVRRAGSDSRFDEIKTDAPRFLTTWTLQGLWVAFTASAPWIAVSSVERAPADAWLVVGGLIWAAGLGIEATADAQKRRFASDPANKGRFITTGLWSRSRHPNYLGEIVLWVGVAIIAVPVLSGWQWVALLSPVFVTVLLTKLSGVPLLEAKAKARWGNEPNYQEYARSTPVLVPRLRKSA